MRAVELATGASRPVVQEQEVWYDAERGLKKTVVRVDATTLDVMLETPKGGVTAHGIVYDCAWIAAHPVEATKAHVSCDASGDNGTTPRVIPRPKPSLDPGLAGFVDGYRRALAAGQAREAGSGDLDGKQVDWLVFRTSDGSERVALDADSHKPVLLADEDHGLRLRITNDRDDPLRGDRLRPAEAGRGAPRAVVRTEQGLGRAAVRGGRDRGSDAERALGRQDAERAAARQGRAANAPHRLRRSEAAAQGHRAGARLRLDRLPTAVSTGRSRTSGSASRPAATSLSATSGASRAATTQPPGSST